MSGEEQLYYIQDARSYVGDAVVWWRAEGRGYTTDVDEAGLFPRSKISGLRETDVAIPREAVDRARKVRVVMAGDLHDAREKQG